MKYLRLIVLMVELGEMLEDRNREACIFKINEISNVLQLNKSDLSGKRKELHDLLVRTLREIAFLIRDNKFNEALYSTDYIRNIPILLLYRDEAEFLKGYNYFMDVTHTLYKGRIGQKCIS